MILTVDNVFLWGLVPGVGAGLIFLGIPSFRCICTLVPMGPEHLTFWTKGPRLGILLISTVVQVLARGPDRGPGGQGGGQSSPSTGW